jgi:hypothetical protein
LFGGIDKDYRDTDVTTQQTTTTNSSNLDADSIFEINSKCLSLAEQKYKSKELSSEEYQATLKLLQNILESEVKRLTIQQTLVFCFYMSDQLFYSDIQNPIFSCRKKKLLILRVRVWSRYTSTSCSKYKLTCPPRRCRKISD